MTFNENYFKLLNFVKATEIVLSEQLDKFCEVNEITEQQKTNLIRTLKSKREIFQDKSNRFYSASDVVNYQKLTTPLEKTIWFYISKCKEYPYCNFNPKMPANAYMCSTDNNEFKELTVFYIPEGTEKVQSRIIETVYGGMPSKVPTALIFPNQNGLEDVSLSDNFELKSIATVDSKGIVTNLI